MAERADDETMLMLTVRVPTDLLTALERQAKRSHRTRSDQIRHYIWKGLETQQSKDARA